MINDRGPQVDHVHLVVHPVLTEYIGTGFKRTNLSATV